MTDPHAPQPPVLRRSPVVGRTVVALSAVVALLAVAAVAGNLLTRKDSSHRASGAVLDALDYIPANASLVEISDQRQAEHRLGIDGVSTGADATETKRYIDEETSAPWIVNAFTDYLMPMNDNGAAFTALDVDWSASIAVGPAGSSSGVQLFGMDSRLDLDAVADDMVAAGWKESALEGRRRLQPDFAAADPVTGMLGAYPARVADLVLLPAEHLMISGDYQGVLDVIGGDSASLRTADDVTQLLGADTAPEYVYITRGDQTCTDLAALVGTSATPGQMEQVRKALGASDIGTPSATASLILPDGTTVRTTSRLLFGSAREAAQDKVARATYLREGLSASTRQPIAELLHVDLMTVVGFIESVDYTYERGPSEVLQAVAKRDVLPTLCLG